MNNLHKCLSQVAIRTNYMVLGPITQGLLLNLYILCLFLFNYQNLEINKESKSQFCALYVAISFVNGQNGPY